MTKDKIKLENIWDAWGYCRENDEELEITENYTFEGYDGKSYPAHATLHVEDDGTFFVINDEYQDENGEWISTENNSFWAEHEIKDTFFPFYVPFKI